MSEPHLGHFNVEVLSDVSNIMLKYYRARIPAAALNRRLFHNRLNAFAARGYYTLPVSQDSLCTAPPQPMTDASDVLAHQRRRLSELLHEVRAANPFYREKLSPGIEPSNPALLESLPFTTRAEIEADQLTHPPYGTNLT